MAIRSALAAAKGRGAAKRSAKSSLFKSKKKTASVGRKRKPAMSDDARRKKVREAVRRHRAKKYKQNLTYIKYVGWVPRLGKGKRRSGKKSPFWGKPVPNLAGRLAKRSKTQAARKPGFNAGGRRRTKANKLGKRPVRKLTKRTTAKRVGNKTDGRSKAARAAKQSAFWSKFSKV